MSLKSNTNEKSTDHSSAEQRFWSYVDRSGECWTWLGHKNPKGYGSFSFRSRSVRAHRFVWELTRGPIPEGLWVLHHCDNPACVNPSHLWLGDNTDNTRDRQNKRRQTVGESHGRARLTEQQVREIRHASACGTTSTTELAAQLGITPQHVLRIVSHRRWQHVT